VGSYPFPFGIKFSLVSIRKPIFLSRSRPSFDSRCEPCIVLKKIVKVFCLQMKILRETHLFFSIVSNIISSTNSGKHCLSKKCRTCTFDKFSLAETVEMGGTCLGEQKSIQSKVVFISQKLYYYTEDTFTRNCMQGFSDIRKNEKVLL